MQDRQRTWPTPRARRSDSSRNSARARNWEFAGARQFVRLAANTARQAAAAAAAGADPRLAAQSAALAAARKFCSRPRRLESRHGRWRGYGSAPWWDIDQSRAAGCVAATRSCCSLCRGVATIVPLAARLLEEEARALMTRLDRIKPFALLEPMVPAASLYPNAQSAIEQAMVEGRRGCGVSSAASSPGFGRSKSVATAEQAQRRLAILRLRFHAVLNEFDMFGDAITQRSEQDNGTWLSGLDIVAADALCLPGQFYELPPIICYLDRGPASSLRRARARDFWGRHWDPVALIKGAPRAHGGGAGLRLHLSTRVGHQGAALLDLVPSLRGALQEVCSARTPPIATWAAGSALDFRNRGDFRIGRARRRHRDTRTHRRRQPAACVRLPRRSQRSSPFAMAARQAQRGDVDRRSTPDLQWARLTALWEELIPRKGLDPERGALFERLEALMPAFVALLAGHRPAELRGRTLPEVLTVSTRAPTELTRLFSAWSEAPAEMYRARPTLVSQCSDKRAPMAVFSPEDESVLIGKLLTFWALKTVLDTSYECALMSGRLRQSRAAARQPQPHSLTIH